jgi:hypothetical protein
MSPIQILAGVVNQTLLGRWSKMTESAALQRANPTVLRMALSYIRNLEARPAVRSVGDSTVVTNRLWEFVLSCALIGSLFYMIYEKDSSLKSFYFIYFINLVVLVALRWYFSSLFEEKKHYVIAASEDSLHASQLNQIAGDKRALSAMIDSSPESSSGDVSTDADVAAMTQTALPAPPGITEAVLDDNAEEAFKEMRTHLSSVRRYHRIVLWLLIIAFLSFISFGFWKMITSLKTTSDYLQAFGSAGIGGILLWFGQRALYANRVSQLSLALFESYVAEARISLAEIPANESASNRRQRRGEVWKDFRLGLNQLWLSERRLSKEQTKRKGSR